MKPSVKDAEEIQQVQSCMKRDVMEREKRNLIQNLKAQGPLWWRLTRMKAKRNTAKKVYKPFL